MTRWVTDRMLQIYVAVVVTISFVILMIQVIQKYG